LQARGFHTRLVYGRLGAGEGDMRYRLPDGIDAHHVPALRRSIAPVHDVGALARTFRTLCAFRPAIVHTHMAKAGTIGRLAAALYNRTAGRSAPARLVHTYHGHVLEGYFSPRTAELFEWTERQLARVTDAIVAISPRVRAEMFEEYHIGQLSQYRVIPLGFDLTVLASIDDDARRAAREALGLSSDAHVISTVGRLTAIKHQSLFLETAQLVAAQDPRALFLIAGDGELRRELVAAAQAFGIADRTRFLGWRRDLATVYGASDVFVLTSRNEGTPVALIESLAAGVPGVSTDVGGVRDVIEDDTVGLLAPFGDARKLASHVRALLDNPLWRRLLGERGREMVLVRYGLDRLVNDVERLYRDLLRSSAG